MQEKLLQGGGAQAGDIVGGVVLDELVVDEVGRDVVKYGCRDAADVQGLEQQE